MSAPVISRALEATVLVAKAGIPAWGWVLIVLGGLVGMYYLWVFIQRRRHPWATAIEIPGVGFIKARVTYLIEKVKSKVRHTKPILETAPAEMAIKVTEPQEPAPVADPSPEPDPQEEVREAQQNAKPVHKRRKIKHREVKHV
jgi:hypothetical protein